MKFSAIVAATGLAAAASSADAASMPGGALRCTVNTVGQYYQFAYLRRNACNNQAPLATLYNGNTVFTQAGTAPKSGCGHTYAKVWVVDKWGRRTNGWMDASYLKCGSRPAPPAPVNYQCSADSDCGADQACEGHWCVAVHCDPGCTTCVHGQCLDPVNDQCSADSDCADDQACEGSWCVSVHCDPGCDNCVHGQCMDGPYY